MIKTCRHSWAIYSLIVALALIVPLLTENVASAATYYVATTGNDANSCATAQNIAMPKRTIASGLTCMSTGDTLFIRGGTYVEQINSNNQTIPSGTSWGNAPIIAGYPGETVILRPTGVSEVLNLRASYIQYVIFKDLHLDGVNVSFTVSLGNATHVRLQGVEVYNASASGILTSYGSMTNPANTYYEFISCHVHHNGSGHFDHGIYIGTSSNLIQGCSIHDNTSYGVHVYTSGGKVTSNNTVRDSDIYNNATQDNYAAGIGFFVGDNNVAFNNVIRGSNKRGFHIDYGASNTKVYNNTIYNNAADGVTISVATNTEVKNNIIWNNTGTISNGGSGTVTQTNLTTNPSFVNAAGLDFHLLSTSAAINAGTALSAVPTDKDGKTRPQGSAYDVGAYELASADTTPPTAPTGLMVQ